MAVLPNDLSKVDPADAWKPWAPTATEPWDRKRTAHLFRRAAFGATPTEIDAALKEGYPKTLERFLKGEPDAADRLELLTETGQFYTEPANLRVWWLYAMLEGGYPLREKLTLFWHNHFATSYAKVRSTKLMYEQNTLIRKHALGHFRPFLLDMSRDTAMLVWLDSNRNVKGAPNENYAREVMELFSLGVGNYTEKDVQEAARAFTGWHHDAEVSKFEDNAVLHDDGEKTIFGKRGNWSGADVVRLCCDHEACARFLVGKLYAFLISETKPPAKLLEPLEVSFRKSDYDIGTLVGVMLSSNLFFSEHAFHKRVKWPVEYAVGAVRAVVPGRVPLADITDPLAKMGQVLFAPPNVKGWRTGTDWLNSATLLARNNFAEKVAIGQWNRQPRPRGNTFTRVQAFQTAEDGTPKPAGPPPIPTADQDPVVAVFATHPKDIPAVVKRMGELLNGEPLSPKVAAKLEQFLRERGPDAPPAPTQAPGPSGGLAPLPPETTAKPAPVPPRDVPTELLGSKPTPAPMPHTAPPFKPDLASDNFKARVREALHAMMCLPEYQLN